ncbi:MAG: type 4a pilus biogenesis protein PilO [Candidatus Omnitrophota bacterium]
MRKITTETVVKYVNNLASREKIMLLVMVATAMFFVDNFFFIRPLWDVFARNLPELKECRTELKTLKDDAQNSRLIAQKWEAAKTRLGHCDSRFVLMQEMPTLLEDLSKSAQKASIRIISIVPQEAVQGDTDPYLRFAIKIVASAGLHEFGRFLAELEGGGTYFRVLDVNIKANPTDEKRHLIEVLVEGFRKGN